MRKNANKLAVAAMAGTVGLIAAGSTQASLVITNVETPGVVTPNGTFDKYVFTLASVSGGDTATGPSNQNAEILLFEGTFTATGAGKLLATPGDSDSSSNGYWTKYITKGAVVPGGAVASNVNLPSENESFPPSRGGAVGVGATYANPTAPSTSAVTGVTGNAANLHASWYVAPTTAAHAGGIEPVSTGVTAARTTVATIYVTAGGGISFSGDYGTFDVADGLQNLTFSTAAVVTSTPGHPIVSLTAQGSQNAAYTNPLGLLHVVGSNGSYVPAFDHTVNSAIGVAEVTGFSPATDNETYALKLVGLSATPATAATQIATIIADINAGAGGVTALVPTADVASIFPGYQIELTANALNRSADQSFGFDFSQETNIAGITVSDVAAVPEPASIAGLVLGASMLLGRRKRTA